MHQVRLVHTEHPVQYLRHVVVVRHQVHAILAHLIPIAIAVRADHMHQVRLVHTEHREQCLRPVAVVRQAVHVIPAHQTRVLE